MKDFFPFLHVSFLDTLPHREESKTLTQIWVQETGIYYMVAAGLTEGRGW